MWVRRPSNVVLAFPGQRHIARDKVIRNLQGLRIHLSEDRNLRDHAAEELRLGGTGSLAN